MVCINCNEYGHTYRYCKKPITSYGIIAVKNYNYPSFAITNIITENSSNAIGSTTSIPPIKELEFLTVQRRDTIGYIDFLRGKYSSFNYLKILLQEMTQSEHQKLRVHSFDELWNLLWISKNSKTYRNEYVNAKKKFELIDINFLLDSTPTKFTENEKDLPKGRRNNTETIKECAIREFMEETSYQSNDFEILPLDPVEEVFLGSNSIWYKHVYFLAEIRTNVVPEIGKNPLQAREIKGIEWLNFKDTICTFRSYDITKRSIIYKTKKILEDFQISIYNFRNRDPF